MFIFQSLGWLTLNSKIVDIFILMTFGIEYNSKCHLTVRIEYNALIPYYIRKICCNNLKWRNHYNKLIPIIFSIYCSKNFKLIAYCNELFYNLVQWQTVTKILLQWSDIYYSTIYYYNRCDVIIYYNKDIVAIIWSKLFVPIIWSKLFVIYCNKIRKVIVYCYKIFKAVNCLLQQYIYIYIYHCIKVSCGTLDMMR